MKFVVTVTALLTALGACVAENRSPDDVAVYELNSRASDRIPTVSGEDALMYLADKLDISDQFSVGSDSTFGDFISSKAPLRSKQEKPDMVVVINGANNLFDTPSFKVADKDGHFHRSVARHLFRKKATGGSASELTSEIRVVAPSVKSSSLVDHFRLFDDRLVGLWQHYTGHRQAVLGGVSGISDRLFVNELSQLVHLDEVAADNQTTVFMTLVSLSSVGRKAGFDSHSYNTACSVVSDLLTSLAQKYDVVVVAVPENHLQKAVDKHMQKRNLELATVFKRTSGSSSCFTSQEACEAGTSKCSGHGKCIESGKECWSCGCSPTKKDGKTTIWAGFDCSKKDISAQAHILLWTGLVLIVTVGAGIKLLAGIGSETLPGVLDAATLKKSQQ
ncbi:hypothetical protein PGUG_04061 [Meyerozyma guilliermondii ATCC 6260]|uniref:Vacuolar sorting protein Vps3844 C-terminal domain-containing protein n=1 Tax=Meyerozyma guilliermondii (strain ATCC 6260 / CBS 566 / DSM 6381 / JCM 1539 / NBRC 10279 / NRRL Y-324) TaxID=294746 RepID=A5DLB0_PICGU|nr:uncharacterized protein PGUG_04061 [Meyerozyma guilliermondii ATCC 6260]EDK39963.2 hypothetical protein PGUG_04061 [Meyerozyma guilliermondii ATCC 6260]